MGEFGAETCPSTYGEDAPKMAVCGAKYAVQYLAELLGA